MAVQIDPCSTTPLPSRGGDQGTEAGGRERASGPRARVLSLTKAHLCPSQGWMEHCFAQLQRGFPQQRAAGGSSSPPWLRGDGIFSPPGTGWHQGSPGKHGKEVPFAHRLLQRQRGKQGPGHISLEAVSVSTICVGDPI